MKDNGIDSGSTKSDRRSSDRYECSLKVIYRDCDKWMTGVASDISEEGIRINTSQPFEQGRKLTIPAPSPLLSRYFILSQQLRRSSRRLSIVVKSA